MTRAAAIKQRLEAHFTPQELSVVDESIQHAGHAGAAGGESHFRVRIVAEAFRGLPPLARHRAIYVALDDMLKSDIHALCIEALAPPPAKPVGDACG